MAPEHFMRSSFIWFAANLPNLESGVYHFGPADCPFGASTKSIASWLYSRAAKRGRGIAGRST